MTTTRRLAAILAADVAGYSRLMAADEVGTLQALKTCRRDIVDPAIAEHKGRIVKTTGDGMLVEFASAVDAVTCAMAVQEKMAARGGALSFRIGINVGDIIIDGDDIFGDGVNVAARVENECKPGRVYLSDDAFPQLRAKTSFTFDDLGEKTLKNLDRPIRIYIVNTSGPASAHATTTTPEPGKPLPLPDKPSIAVLPFQNMSGDPEQEYFADGMVEDIITALSRFKSLFVIARNSSFTYKGKVVDIKQVGRDLGVRYVLEGSVRKAAGRVRITGQLIEAATDTHLWADRFDGSLEDAFELQDQVTRQVVGAIAPAVQTAERRRLNERRTNSITAYDCQLQAYPLLRTGRREEMRNGVQLLKKAIALDPGYALAHATAASGYGWLAQANMLDEQEDVSVEAIGYANRALELDSTDPDVLSEAAYAIVVFDHNVSRHQKLLELALDFNPNLARAWLLKAWGHVWAGEHEFAIEHFNRGLRINPVDPFRWNAFQGLACASLDQR